MISEAKQLLFDKMNEDNGMFYPYNNVDFYQELPSKSVGDIIENIAHLFNGRIFYYKIINYVIRITYIFEDDVNNYLFRNELKNNFISYNSTGYNTKTYIELTSL